ncbi:flavodoxin family protein [Lachnospiraceae bacterium]|nr:flavodoxin family protein [Lachnospiraceae bacterium]
MSEKKILVLTGSPRLHGNSDQMAEAFAEGARFAGHTVMKFEAGRKQISGCLACKMCRRSGRCVRKDDFMELVPLAENAQVLVLVSPLYSFAFSAQLKAAMDRFYCFEAKGGLKQTRESALLLCGGDREEAHYQGAVGSYRQYSSYQGWKDRGIILAKGFSGKGEIDGHPVLEECMRLGKAI